jgi:nicotinamide mononucleotide transporter
MTAIEATAVVFGLLCVWLTIKQNIWCWPTGLIQVSLFIVIFYEAKLYSDLILHVIYIFMQIYGWYYWLHGGKKQSPLQVTTLTPLLLCSWVMVCVCGTFVWGWVMGTFTDASVPYPDAFTTITSLVAQWLMARKKIESWFFWISVDLVAIWIYFYKQLFLTTGLYSIFLVLATIGFFAWQNDKNSLQNLPTKEAAI